MSDPVDVEYFNTLYTANDDPWRLRLGWYEPRKRQLILSSLLKPRYANAFEPGCAVGELTAGLAPRCDRLLSIDLHAAAVQATRERVSGSAQVTVEQRILPEQWPTAETFDLIVLSEIGYFFTPSAWARTCELAAAGTRPGATVLACHWRHDFAERQQSTTRLHDVLGKALNRRHRLQVLDEDFVIDVWSDSEQSLAEADGLR